MIKILMYNIMDDEKIVVTEWLTHHHDVQIDWNTVTLNPDTVDLAKGYDGISTEQDNLIDDPIVYEKLHAFGIKQITLRITGYDTINLSLATQNNLKITNVPAYSPRSVSEMVLAQTMWLLRNLNTAQQRTQNHDFTWEGLQSREIHDLIVGIIGAGKIGSEVARIFKALGATVIAADPIHRPELNSVLTYVNHETIFKTADIITTHTPLLDSTYHLFDESVFQQMKPSAIFINASRGGVVDTPALIAALNNHTIAAAGLDTIEGEADIFSNDFSDNDFDNDDLKTILAMPNAIITPHIGFYTDNAIRNMVEISLHDMLTIIAGKTSEHELN
ncbi:D-2-hydroxyacid dehydrogenase [Weissella hellenica]|uniref:D-lactate dehydrogenase n=1 Tax=Weissella hellenica TaxID=46256 RepID=A0ABY0JYV1_WEIHE|nr:D-2-hydroxyacid dehydrogenase [Weissella hellenica]GED35418.1 lactate dehydrogenase [Weissella hellenica]SCB73764.1 D-lactate dehydrogenase [Weissella hellenica]